MVTGGVGTEDLGAVKGVTTPIDSFLLKVMQPIEELHHTNAEEFLRGFVSCYAPSTEYRLPIPSKIGCQANSATTLFWLGWDHNLLKPEVLWIPFDMIGGLHQRDTCLVHGGSL